MLAHLKIWCTVLVETNTKTNHIFFSHNLGNCFNILWRDFTQSSSLWKILHRLEIAPNTFDGVAQEKEKTIIESQNIFQDKIYWLKRACDDDIPIKKRESWWLANMWCCIVYRSQYKTFLPGSKRLPNTNCGMKKFPFSSSPSPFHSLFLSSPTPKITRWIL